MPETTRPIPLFQRLTLQQLVLLLAGFTLLVSLLIGLYASYQVKRQLLITTTLEANRAYSSKVAQTTGMFLEAAISQLSVAVSRLQDHQDDYSFMAHELARLREEQYFNSVAITNAENRIIVASPGSLQLEGRSVNLDAIHYTEFGNLLISDPYHASTGRTLVLFGMPFMKDGEPNGHVFGSIYLNKDSVLLRLLSSHDFQDDSYLYVVDRHGQLMLHQDLRRIGEDVSQNKVVQDLMAGNTGAMSVINSRGIEMLAGYAPVEKTGWGIVTQRPMQSITAELNELMLVTLGHALPWLLLVLAVVWWLASLIARPLNQLADIASNMGDTDVLEHARTLSTPYSEARALRHGLLKGLSALHVTLDRLDHERLTDPLTGLLNRRGMEQALAREAAESQSMSVIIADIDHFKKVNDTYGHDVGDHVLVHLARQLQGKGVPGQIICRSGGEEFMILLPDTSLEAAAELANDYRRRVEANPTEDQISITISLGVAHQKGNLTELSNTLKQADQALYQAKHQGRNQVIAA
ncbi:diguanylate cyclase [Pokkaliibacter sp. CJK22405]|uniref:sensor domain-containing diguanylate cyclase n=1 Tax=Pokkaliibacter sp. CJK22405 TaxID=3384615 RepID=UPI0039853B68